MREIFIELTISDIETGTGTVELSGNNFQAITSGFIISDDLPLVGELNEKYTDLPEINRLELFTVIPLLIITLFFGIYPAPYLDVISSTMDNIINHVVSLATLASM